MKYRKLSTVILIVVLVITTLIPSQAFAASSYVKSLTVSKTAVTVKAGKSVSVTATVSVSGSAKKTVSVSSSNTAVATVTKGTPVKGKTKITIKGKKKGSATITVKTVGKNKSKKIISKKIKVTVGYADVTSLSVTPSSKNLVVTDTCKITKKVSPATANQAVTYSSSDTRIAKVSSSGTITAVGEGTATITVKTTGKNSKNASISKKISVTVAPMYTYELGTVEKYVEFEIQSELSKADLEAAGYTIVGNTASRTNICNTCKYTFNKLPANAEQIKLISLSGPDKEFASTAALICAIHMFDKSKGDRTNNAPLSESIGYLVGPNQADYITGPYGGVNRSFVAGQLIDHPDIMNCYFDGATSFNKYTPNEPYTISLYEGPYYIPAQNTVNGPRPQTDMIFVSGEGFDTDRYVDVFQSADGNCYIWNTSYRNFFASVKPAAIIW